MPTSSEHSKTSATRVLIYLIEELGDARLRAAQLQKYVKDATDLIEKSEKRDEIFEVAAHLVHGIPETLFKLSKALDASAMAASRLDYEEIKQTLRPEKADELEAVMDDNRLRVLKKQSQEVMMDPKQASEVLVKMADTLHETGILPLRPLAQMVSSLEGRTASSASTEEILRKLASDLTSSERPSRTNLVASLRQVLADAIRDQIAGAGEEFQKVNPAITDDQAREIDEKHEENKDNFKSAASAASLAKRIVDRMMQKDLAPFELVREFGLSTDVARAIYDMAAHHFGPGGAGYEKYIKAVTKILPKTASDETSCEKESRFEEGVPADPTKNMSPEDKAEWEKQNEENKDNFKTASHPVQSSAWKVGL